MAKKKELRNISTTGKIESREVNGTLELTGYAAVFNSDSEPLPFIERIAPGAFAKTLSENADVRFLSLDHDGMPLARTRSGTLELSEDEIGLKFVAQLPDTNAARELWTAIDRGDISEMSFTFRVIRQQWSENRARRTLIEVSLVDGDISPVVYPAYKGASVEARNMKDKVVEVQAKLATYKEHRAAENAPAKQLAFDAVVAGLADLIALEAGELKDGEDECYSLDALLEAVEAVFAWRVMENWESEIAPVPTNEMPMESSGISLRLAQAIRSRL